MKCPGDCSNGGNCDTVTGKCTCDVGRHGADCSSKILLNYFIGTHKNINKVTLKYFSLIVFDCPGDGTCSNQGTCDGTTGTCVCFEGFERLSGICRGK